MYAWGKVHQDLNFAILMLIRYFLIYKTLFEEKTGENCDSRTLEISISGILSLETLLSGISICLYSIITISD